MRLVVSCLLLSAATAWAQADGGTTAPSPAANVAASKSQNLTADEAFVTRVRTLEEQVTDLKTKIAMAKARLMTLQETVLGGDLSTGARAVLVHRNEMGGSYVLESFSYALDGAPIKTEVDDTGALSKREEIELFNGRILPGNHQIAVRMVYRGSGSGIFTYLDGYKFKLQATQTFNAEPGKVTTVKIVGFEKGGITTDVKDRPAIRYDISTAKDASLKGKGTDAAQAK